MPKNSPIESVFAGYTEHELPREFVEQFLAHPERAYDVVLEGVMQRIWHRPRWLRLLLRLLGRLGILVPREGENIRSTLSIVPGRYADGTPFHEWNRTFYFDPPLHFNTTVVYDHKMQNLADVVGNPRFLHMVWRGRYHPPDTFTLETVGNALRIGKRLFYLPRWLWALTLGSVDFSQKAHKDDDNVVDVDLRIVHPIFGEVFGYQGTFEAVRYPKERDDDAG